MSSLPTSQLVAAACCALLAFAFLWYSIKPARRLLPPGPRPLPLLGNILQLPAQKHEICFAEWGRRYGDIVYFTVLGKPTIVLHSARVAQDLLEKRSAIYSDRPRFVLFSELMGWQNASTHVRYGARFRKHRRFIHQSFNQRAAQNLLPVQEREALILVNGLTQGSDMLSDHVKRFATATILKVTYGRDVTSVHDPFVMLTEEAATLTVRSGTPAATLVDYVPLMKYIPIWAPSPLSTFKINARKVKAAVDKMMNEPFEMVKNHMEAGTANSSMTLSLLESCMKTGGQLTYEDEQDIKGVAGTLTSAASETTTSVIEAFILAMVLFPEVQAKAQAEMDRVIGNHLPSLNDRDSLPYLDAVIKETYRWCCPVPLGIPHRSMEDDVYNGYYIPKGSTVIANIYAMLRDYPDPDAFRPEQFLDDPELPDPRDIVFGFGRRICPGRYFADSGVWLVAALIIATLAISKAKDEDGNVITPVADFSHGMTRRPFPFKCTIIPRSPRASDCIQRGLELSSL